MAKKAKLVDVGGKPCLIGMEPAPADKKSLKRGTEVWRLHPYFLTENPNKVERAVSRAWVFGAIVYFGDEPPSNERGWHGGRQMYESDVFYPTEADAWEVAMNHFAKWVADRRELIRNRGVRK